MGNLGLAHILHQPRRSNSCTPKGCGIQDLKRYQDAKIKILDCVTGRFKLSWQLELQRHCSYLRNYTAQAGKCYLCLARLHPPWEQKKFMVLCTSLSSSWSPGRSLPHFQLWDFSAEVPKVLSWLLSSVSSRVWRFTQPALPTEHTGCGPT